ncbi:hypothetical protein KL943_004599 [Ogataea angusta]|nr:hypothetical protein KL943_004599 [Ogataea angusta]
MLETATSLLTSSCGATTYACPAVPRILQNDHRLKRADSYVGCREQHGDHLEKDDDLRPRLAAQDPGNLGKRLHRVLWRVEEKKQPPANSTSHQSQEETHHQNQVAGNIPNQRVRVGDERGAHDFRGEQTGTGQPVRRSDRQLLVLPGLVRVGLGLQRLDVEHAVHPVVPPAKRGVLPHFLVLFLERSLGIE